MTRIPDFEFCAPWSIKSSAPILSPIPIHLTLSFISWSVKVTWGLGHLVQLHHPIVHHHTGP